MYANCKKLQAHQHHKINPLTFSLAISMSIVVSCPRASYEREVGVVNARTFTDLLENSRPRNDEPPTHRSSVRCPECTSEITKKSETQIITIVDQGIDLWPEECWCTLSGVLEDEHCLSWTLVEGLPLSLVCSQQKLPTGGRQSVPVR